MEKSIKKKLRLKTVKQIFLLTMPMLLIAAAYAVYIFSADIEGKITQTEDEIYSQIYNSGSDE